MKVEVCIIGGGASAMMCAVNSKSKNVAIIEKSQVGKKILATGNGRCNLTNTDINAEKYNTMLVNNYFKRFSSQDTITFFNNLGLLTYCDNEGRVYPFSNTAHSVLDILNTAIKNKGVKKIENHYAICLEKTNENFVITLDNSEIIEAEKVVLATGGNTNFDFVKNIKIVYNDYYPSLCALKTNRNYFLENIRVSNVKVTLKTQNNIYTDTGEILFKENSISGIVIFNLSSHLSRQKDYNADLYIDFMKDKSFEELQNLLNERKNSLKGNMTDFMTGLFHPSLNKNMLRLAYIKEDSEISSLNEAKIKILCDLIKNYHVKTLDFMDNNQVYSGGIPLKALDENLMSKSTKNLYATGEIIDVDGECGGYNLQWAWTSGYIVGKNL